MEIKHYKIAGKLSINFEGLWFNVRIKGWEFEWLYVGSVRCINPTGDDRGLGLLHLI